jgi:hypothetical protein
MPRELQSLYLRLLRKYGRRRLARQGFHGAGGHLGADWSLLLRLRLWREQLLPRRDGRCCRSDAATVPDPATPLPSPHAEAHRRLAALGLPLSSLAPASPSNSRGRRSGSGNPATLELPNGRADGVAPDARLRGDSSDAGIRGGSTSGRR